MSSGENLLDCPSVRAHLRTLTIATRSANRACHVVCDATTASARDVRALAGVLTLTCCAFTHGGTLLGANENDCVASNEEETELARNFAVNALFSFFKDSVNVNVKRLQLADELAAVLELDDNALVAREVKRVQWACCFDFHSFAETGFVYKTVGVNPRKISL